MPYKEQEIEKKYYSIGEVASMFKVAPSLIRFWESEFEELQLRKNKRGIRIFTKEDLELFGTLYSLVKEKGYTLQGAREIISGNRKKAKDHIEVLETLEKVKSLLLDLRKSIGD